ncbi:hypothetical protein L5515_015706 [Caenorhabditis briggsae]|uniref:Uncharacterized protein n=1 Tax=Caenorhabditis briggsae TaxID=6238 RepID=A0AAE9EFM7_CAEBR|nr:hypothetical protein L5515_015706 [Caenorhabditis briggsae]
MGRTWVYYHVKQRHMVFFIALGTEENLKIYKEWMASKRPHSWIFMELKNELRRVEVRAGEGFVGNRFVDHNDSMKSEVCLSTYLRTQTAAFSLDNTYSLKNRGTTEGINTSNMKMNENASEEKDQGSVEVKGTMSALEITTIVPPKLAAACYNGDVSATISSDTKDVASVCVQPEKNQKAADNAMWLLLSLPSTTFTTVAHQSSSTKLPRRQPPITATILKNSLDARFTGLKSRFEQYISAQEHKSTQIANYMYSKKIFSLRNWESKIADLQ